MAGPHTIVIAHADPATRAFLTDNLTADGYHAHPTSDAAEALDLCVAGAEVLVLGELERGDWMELVRELVAREEPVRIVTLASSGCDLAATRALESGADDHVRSPFSYPELRARIRRLVRDRRPSGARVRIGTVAIDAHTRRVTVAGRSVEVSATEFALLTQLAAHPDRVFTKAELMRAIWGSAAMRSRTLDTHACRLRRKLAEAGAPRMIVNVWGVGYRLFDHVPSSAGNGTPLASQGR